MKISNNIFIKNEKIFKKIMKKEKIKPIPTPSPSSKLKDNFGHSKDYVKRQKESWGNKK